MLEKDSIEKYRSKFSLVKLWSKLRKVASNLGVKVVYTILLLFFAFRRKETPSWAKNIVLGTLGYFLSPFDAIPDLTPIVGYTDDIGILSFGLVTIAAYINDDVREKARKRLGTWFKNYNPEDLKEIDDKL